MTAPRGRAWGWVALLVLGVALVLAGLLGVAFEREYGSGLNFATETRPDGRVLVYEVGEPGETVVFEGTEQEAEQYIESRREAGPRPVVPVLGVVLGAVFVAVAALVARRRVPGATSPRTGQAER